VIGDAIYSHLSADVAVKAMVGERIYPSIAPQTADYPLIQYQQVGGPRMSALESGFYSVRMPVVQIDSYARDPYGGTEHIRQVRLLADAVEEAMKTLPGLYGTVEVKGCAAEGEPRELSEDEGRIARMSQDFQLWWRTAE
jgi:Protein of unknown function (DUF3168)